MLSAASPANEVAGGHVHSLLQARAIKQEFISGPWGNRYVRFEHGDWEAFKAAGHTHCHSWMKRAFVDACGGFVIHRMDPTGARLPSYIRPDEAICTRHGRQSVVMERTKPTCGICGAKLSKYVQASKRVTGRPGKLIDVHPLLVERLHIANEPIYFCLEGCLKADAVAGAGRLAISVPSVTVWEATAEPAHWRVWLPILRRAEVVYVIPDSDYITGSNWAGYAAGTSPVYREGGEVRLNTDRCVQWLRRCQGVNAWFMVPPYMGRADADRFKVGNRFKIGVDDHLATRGNLAKWDAERNPRGVHIWLYKRSPYRALPSLPYDSAKILERDGRFLDWLEESGGEEGYYARDDACLALGWSHTTVWKAKMRCIDRGVLQVVDGSPRGVGKGNEPHMYRLTNRADTPPAEKV
jgi:hypothetical protein